MAFLFTAPDDVRRVEIAQHEARFGILQPVERLVPGIAKAVAQLLADGLSRDIGKIPVDEQLRLDHHRVPIEGRYVVKDPGRRFEAARPFSSMDRRQEFRRGFITRGHRHAFGIEKAFRSRDARSAETPAPDPARKSRGPKRRLGQARGRWRRRPRPTAPYARSRHRVFRHAPADRAPVSANSSAGAAPRPAASRSRRSAPMRRR